MGSTADQYKVRPAGLLLWFVLVCRVMPTEVMPRSLMFQDKLQLYKAKSSTFNSCFFILLYVYWKMEFNLFRFSTIIYLTAFELIEGKLPPQTKKQVKTSEQGIIKLYCKAKRTVNSTVMACLNEVLNMLIFIPNLNAFRDCDITMPTALQNNLFS